MQRSQETRITRSRRLKSRPFNRRFLAMLLLVIATSTATKLSKNERRYEIGFPTRLRGTFAPRSTDREQTHQRVRMGTLDAVVLIQSMDRNLFLPTTYTDDLSCRANRCQSSFPIFLILTIVWR
jgi:hypothetical protein